MVSASTTRPAKSSNPDGAARRSSKPASPPRVAGKAAPPAASPPRDGTSAGDKELPILFQQFFKSENGRTYAAQVKEAGNGNHFLVLTDGRRDPKTDELRRSRIFLFAEDFAPFFRMLHDTAIFIRNNPVSEEVKHRREQRKKAADDRPAAMRQQR